MNAPAAPEFETGSRARILRRIREALQTPAPAAHAGASDPAVPGTADFERWLPAVPADSEGRIALFAANCASLKTEFVRCSNPAAAADALARMARSGGWKKVATHPRRDTGDPLFASAKLQVVVVDATTPPADIESACAAVTSCECLVAQTGSILVSPQAAGGRVLSVLAPHHIVVATTRQLVGDLRDAFRLLRKIYQDDLPNFLSFITGPSRTGDIERILVLGAHGPKRLSVVLVDDDV